MSVKSINTEHKGGEKMSFHRRPQESQTYTVFFGLFKPRRTRKKA